MDRAKLIKTITDEIERQDIEYGPLDENGHMGVDGPLDVRRLADAILALTEQKRAEDDLVLFGSCVVMVTADGTTRHVPLDEFARVIRRQPSEHEKSVSELIKGVRNASKSSGDDQG